ncbi:MAG TPA: TRAP transporter substrate-binding protein DctP [Alphaproteobacteria bacterium]|jgi:TRAP-type C4-dicarboxylate transport system substrate-binding protein
MKRNLLLAGAAGLMAMAVAGPAAYAETVELTLVHPFPDALVYTKSCKELIAKINKAGEGMVKITVRGGNEAIPMFNQPNAVRDGIVDMVCTPAAFYAQAIPENDAISTSNASPAEVRGNGGMALVDKLHGQYMKMKYLGWIDTGVGFYLYMVNAPKFKPDGMPDFSGVKLRDNPIYSAFFKALGATAHNMPATEVYSNLEKRVVDAAAWTSIGLSQLKWDKFVRHRVGPEFFQTDLGILMNVAKWNSLSPQAKDLLQKAVIEHEGTSRAARIKDREADQAALQKEGMVFDDMKPEAAKKYLTLATESAYARMMDRLKAANRPTADAEAIWKAYHK